MSETSLVDSDPDNREFSYEVAFSYASEQKDLVEEIYSCLRRMGLKVFYDKKFEVDSWGKKLVEYFQKIFKEKARYAVIFLSEEYATKVWPKLELESAVERMMDQHSEYILPIKTDDSEIPAPLSKQIKHVSLKEHPPDELCRMIFQKVRSTAHDEEDVLDDKVLSKIEGADSKNPFSKVRAEQFQDDSLLARAFTEPMSSIYESIKSPLPTIILGGRGSGKTTVLRSMTPEVILSRLGKNKVEDLTSNGVRFYGLYFKLEKGSLSIGDNSTIARLILRNFEGGNTLENFTKIYEKLNNKNFSDPIIKEGLERCRRITVQELNFKILKAILVHLNRVNKRSHRHLSISNSEEKATIDRILSELGVEAHSINNLDALIKFFNLELNKITSYIQGVVFPSTKENSPTWISTKSSFLNDVVGLMVENIADLKGLRFYLLFDEFENLEGFQQEIINEWIKTGSFFTVKVASKHNGVYSSDTLEGQPLQQGQDVNVVRLDYDLIDSHNFNKYKTFLKDLSKNLLQISNFRNTNIENILHDPKFEELPSSIIKDEIKKIRAEHNLEFVEERFKAYEEKLGVAATFRILGRTRKRKSYSGLDTFAYLSSGIVRSFMNLIGMAFYLSEEEKIETSGKFFIPAEIQSRAARNVSKIWLERIQTQPNDGEDGVKIYNLILDMGRILKEKLLNDTNEPETLAFSLIDPIRLEESRFSQVKTILGAAVMQSMLTDRVESVTQLPKDPFKNKTRDYSLNRIYAPALRLSYRTRWRGIEITVEELDKLLNPNFREETRKLIQKRFSNKKKGVMNGSQVALDQFPEDKNGS